MPVLRTAARALGLVPADVLDGDAMDLYTRMLGWVQARDGSRGARTAPWLYAEVARPVSRGRISSPRATARRAGSSTGAGGGGEPVGVAPGAANAGTVSPWSGSRPASSRNVRDAGHSPAMHGYGGLASAAADAVAADDYGGPGGDSAHGSDGHVTARPLTPASATVVARGQHGGAHTPDGVGGAGYAHRASSGGLEDASGAGGGDSVVLGVRSATFASTATIAPAPRRVGTPPPAEAGDRPDAAAASLPSPLVSIYRIVECLRECLRGRIAPAKVASAFDALATLPIVLSDAPPGGGWNPATMCARARARGGGVVLHNDKFVFVCAVTSSWRRRWRLPSTAGGPGARMRSARASRCSGSRASACAAAPTTRA